MNNKLLLIVCASVSLFVGNLYAQKTNLHVTYPETTQGKTIDNYFGNDVPDPYRWLEDDRSVDTENWVKSQNAVTQGYMSHIPYRDPI